MTDEALDIANRKYWSAKAKDGWRVKVLGNYVIESKMNDDWSFDIKPPMVALSYGDALDIAIRFIQLHGGASEEKNLAPFSIPTGMAVKMLHGFDEYLTHYWLDENGAPSYGIAPGEKMLASSKKTHDRLCLFIESQLLPHGEIL